MAIKTKKQAMLEVAEYITPRDCFIWYTGNEKGWEPISGTGCAHYVAHQKNIRGSGSNKCYKGFAFRVTQVIEGIPKRNHIDQVREGDIWAKIGGKDQHCGIVTGVTPGKHVVNKITHCSSRAGAVITSNYGSEILGGGFYGTTMETEYLGNTNSKKVHVLSKSKANCRIDQMNSEHKVYFKSLEDAIAYGYSYCAYCRKESMLKHKE